MSYEIYVQCFKDGAPAGIPREQVRAAFGKFLTEVERTMWHVRYDDENSCDINVDAYKDDESLVHHLCIERPCGDGRLWNALAAVLKLGPVVLYFPGEAPPLVAAQSVVRHLPPDMVESLGTPVSVANGDEIVQHIEAA